VTFHDGSACTAADVVATFEAILDAKTASPARQNVGRSPR
jgi:peptide/nickel transport system substrate-binding protein